MPSPVKTGLFPAETATTKACRSASPEAGEAFHDEFVRHRRAEAEKEQKPEAAAKPGAKRAEKKAGKPARRAADEGGAPRADVATDAASGPEESAAPEAAPEADGAAEAPAEAEGSRVDRDEDEADGDEATGNTPAVAVTASPTISAAANSGGEAAEPADEGATTPHVTAERPSVYQAGEPGSEAEAFAEGNAADGDATPGTVAGLFNSTEGEAGADDRPPEHSAGAGAASAAVSEAVPGAGDAGAFPGVAAETSSSPAHPDAASSPASVAARFSDAGLQVPDAPHRPRSDAPSAPATAPIAATPPEVRFAEANHSNIVTSMRGELLPNGGSMRIRLDPPQLGALQVTVQMRDGLMTAAFETSNDEATRLLGHSLNHLKGVLESHGVAVDKLQVQQAPREAQAQTPGDDARREQGGSSQEQEQSARQEQQRREMLRRMWRRLAGGQDPLDLTA